MSTLPNAASVASRSASSVSRLVTSAVRRSVLRPAASIASAVAATSAGAPRRRDHVGARRRQPRLIARPIPDVPPRTTAVRPSRLSDGRAARTRRQIYHHMLADSEIMSLSGTQVEFSSGGSPTRINVFAPLNQCEYWMTIWSVACQSVRRMTRGETTANA